MGDGSFSFFRGIKFIILYVVQGQSEDRFIYLGWEFQEVKD